MTPDDDVQPAAKPSDDLLKLEALAKAAGKRQQWKRWQQHRDGALEAPSYEVRSLTDNEDARAQAHASLARIISKKTGKPRKY